MIDAKINVPDVNLMLLGLGKIDATTMRVIKTTLREEGKNAVQSVKKRTPIGWEKDLKKSWKYKVTIPKKHSVMLTIENTAKYWSFVEYGHRNEAGRFVPGVWINGRFKYIKYTGQKNLGGMKLSGAPARGRYFWRPVRRKLELRVKTAVRWKLTRELMRLTR